MKELVEYIAKAIVNKPDDVVVTEEQSEGGVLLKLQVDQEDGDAALGAIEADAEAGRHGGHGPSGRAGCLTDERPALAHRGGICPCGLVTLGDPADAP